jgi:hypothetical protein
MYKGKNEEDTLFRVIHRGRLILFRTTNVANRCPPSYARSTPPTNLESTAPPQKRRRQRGKDEKNDLFEHCELSATEKKG